MEAKLDGRSKAVNQLKRTRALKPARLVIYLFKQNDNPPESRVHDDSKLNLSMLT